MLKFSGRPWHRKKGWVIACLSQVKGKIEYRNPCLLPGVGFTEALAASFTHSIPTALTLPEIKKCYSRNPADSCLSNTQPYTHTDESGTHAETQQDLGDLLTSSERQKRGIETYSHSRNDTLLMQVGIKSNTDNMNLLKTLFF